MSKFKKGDSVKWKLSVLNNTEKILGYGKIVARVASVGAYGDVDVIVTRVANPGNKTPYHPDSYMSMREEDIMLVKPPKRITIRDLRR